MMLKRLIGILLSLAVLFSITVSADSTGEMPAADLLDVSFTADGFTDAAGAAAITKSEGLTILYDETVKMNAAEFSGEGYMHADGSFMANDYLICHFGKEKFAQHVNAFTLEAYFCIEKLPSANMGSVCPISGQQGGGLGFEVSSLGQLAFFCKSGSAYNSPKKDGVIEAGKYYHAMGVFDGSTVSLYLNGELIASEAANGATIVWPSGEEHNALVIGGDVGTEGKADHGITGRVACAKAYSAALTAQQVSAEYAHITEASSGPDDTQPPVQNTETGDTAFLCSAMLVLSVLAGWILKKKTAF